MEPVGAAASGLTILAAISQTTKKIFQIYKRYLDAPEDIARVHHHLELIQSTTQFLSMLATDVVNGTLPISEREHQLILNALENAATSLSNVLHACSALDPSLKRDIKMRLVWSIKQGPELQRILHRLGDTESNLSLALQVLQLRLISTSRIERSEAEKRIMEQASSIENLLKTHHKELAQPLTSNDNSVAVYGCTRGADHPSENLIASQLAVPFSKATEGDEPRSLNLALGKVEASRYTLYQIFLQLCIPYLKKRKLLKADIAFRVGVPWYENIHLLGGHIGLKNIIAINSATVQACLDGDLTLLRELFKQKRASANDVTEDSRPLLWYAATSDSVETVQFLLANGADATALTGPYHTELLSRAFFKRRLATSRLLLQKGVDVDHISGIGMTPIFHLYNPSNTDALSKEFLELLISHDFTNVNVQTIDGWSALHRCASFGSAEDIKHLLSYQADPKLRTFKMHWTPLFCAISFGNTETVRELIKLEHRPLKELVDIRGWSLLHVAVDFSAFGTVPILVEAGMDPWVSCLSTHSLGPEELQGRSITPGDVAEYHGTERLKMYCDALRLAGLELELDGDGDVFWPSETETSSLI